MVNTDDFIKRLEVLLEYYSLSASLFADKLGVQRSGLSHLMSGRNKPSLDFVMKIVENFPEVDLYWLLNGSGKFPLNTDDGTEMQNPNEKLPGASPPLLLNNGNEIGDLFSQPEENPIGQPAKTFEQEVKIAQARKKTERIVVFYSDGTFNEYFPQE